MDNANRKLLHGINAHLLAGALLDGDHYEKPVKHNVPLKGIDIDLEYDRIMAKESNLSSNMRKKVIAIARSQGRII